VLAIVIFGVGIAMNLLQPKDVAQRPAPVTEQPGRTDYEQGIAALASGETTKAIGLLEKAAGTGSTAARAKLDEIAKAPAKTPSVVASDTFTSKVSDIGSLLPASVPGYRMAEVETSTASAIVSAEPASSGPISRVAFTVSDRKSAARAASWLSGFSKAYPKSLADVNVGDVSGRFGTDGAHLAAVSFVRGRFGFEVVATAVSGDPKQLKTLVIQAASAFAAAHTE
jgi:hypothetical protein